MIHNLPPGEYEILKRLGLSLKRRAVDLKEIDWDKSSKNHARNSEINEQHLEDLTVSAKAGATFPDVVLWQSSKNSKNKKLVILGGTHRCKALMAAGKTEVMAVIVVSDDEEMAETLPGILNTTSGLPLTRAEKTQRARAAIKQWNWSVSNAAKAFGLNESSLARAISAEDIRASLEKMNVRTGDLTEFHLLAMKPISHNDHVLAEVGRMATAAKTTGADIRDVVKQVKKERSESAMLDRAKSLRAELIGVTHRSNGHAPRRSKAIELKMATTHLLRLLREVSSVKQFGITKTEDIEKTESEFRSLASELRRVADRKARGKTGAKQVSGV